MMRLSCLTLSYQNQFKAGKMDIFKFMDTCRSLNFDGIDVHRSALTATDKDYLKKIRRHALDCGLTVSAMCVSTEFGRRTDAEIPAEIEKAKESIEIGMMLGAPVLRVFVGSAPSADKTEEAFRRGVDALRKTAELGATYGMPVALQNHSGLTSTGDDMLKFYKAVNHPNFMLLLDTGHFAGRTGPNGPKIEGTTYADYYRSIEQVATYAKFVRVKLYELDANGKERHIDYARVFNILRGVHYNGFCSLVYEGKEDELTAIPRGARFLRSFVSAC
ncbi:MAG: sugar phosphate isomerase/epimerase [Bryobacterales bacterium]|nr:sugar phosphate isomerase/epimerase [Bryobacterales bacterium]